MKLESYMPQLYNNQKGNWVNGNQQSTYELCIHIRRQLTNNTKSYSSDADDRWVTNLYNTVKNDPNTYGTYAGLDNWSHYFTDTQLENFYTLVSSSPL
jgi:hypothetical protein